MKRTMRRGYRWPNGHFAIVGGLRNSYRVSYIETAQRMNARWPERPGYAVFYPWNWKRIKGTGPLRRTVNVFYKITDRPD